MFVEAGLLITVVALLVIFMRHNLSKPRNLPPGPPGLPVIGNAAQMRKNGFAKVTEWHKKYGDTITVHMGQRPMIIMRDYHTIKNVFSDEITSGRELHVLEFFRNRGLIRNQGKVWKEHRRFAISRLRDMGMGKTWLENDIIAEAEDMCSILRQTHGSPIDPKTVVSHSVSNVICSLVFGKRFSHSDEKFTRLTSLLAENVLLNGQDSPILQILPLLKFIPGHFQKRWQTYLRNMEDLKAFTTSLIKEHASRTSTKEERNDYISAYLAEARRQQGTQSSFDDVELLVSVINLFTAGTETTSTTLLWSFVYLLENPEVMRKVHEEIDSVIGSDPVVRIDHRSRLHYTEATIMEVQRCANLVPLGVPHVALEEVRIDRYRVPKGALLASNLASMHMDSRYWDQPEVFNPDRFLDAEGKLKKLERFAPFSVGKRTCLGESLAKMELYLFFSNILRTFELKNAPARRVSHSDDMVGIVRSPKPYEIVFVARR